MAGDASGVGAAVGLAVIAVGVMLDPQAPTSASVANRTAARRVRLRSPTLTRIAMSLCARAHVVKVWMVGRGPGRAVIPRTSSEGPGLGPPTSVRKRAGETTAGVRAVTGTDVGTSLAAAPSGTSGT